MEYHAQIRKKSITVTKEREEKNPKKVSFGWALVTHTCTLSYFEAEISRITV
jgi:hypothetical protein